MLKGFLPSHTDLENGELKEILETVKAGSVKETLTHLMAWEAKNIMYWRERGNIFYNIIFYVCILMPIWYVSLYLFFGLHWSLTIVLPLTCFVVISLLNICLMSRYRSKDIKFRNTFRINLSVEIILKYQLGVCRDYAKLTMALLSNLCLPYKKFFITIPNHVAVAIEVDGDCYVLDQDLPILPINNWLQLWIKKHKVGYCRLFFHRYKIMEWDTGQLKKSVSNPRPRLWQKIPHVDTSQIERDLIQRLKMQYVPNVDNHNQETIKMKKNFALYYADNELTRFTFVEALRNKIENRFDNEIHKISKITVIQDGRDIVLEIYINTGRY